MKKLFAAISFVCALALVSRAAEEKKEVKIPQPAQAANLGESARNEARASVNRAMDWLLKKQNPDGSWSTTNFPALTALPLWALTVSGCENKEAMDRAAKFILARAHDDGSIFQEGKGGGLRNYNTALCMIALQMSGRPDAVPVVQKARTFLAGMQHLGSDEFNGGMGYDSAASRNSADLSNSYMAFEAMRLTQNVEDLRKQGDKHADLDWKAAQDFLSRVQNCRTDDAASEKGGFAYSPKESKAGTFTNADGTIHFRSYGSMTYAGLLSLIYADVKKDDPRVTAAFDWSTKHWSLDENPGVGQQGLFYFLNVLGKSLAAHGQDVIVLPDGKKINWREELINKLVNLQKIDNGTGYWINEANRWEEGDPVLVTSYAIIALEIALGSK